MVGANLRLNDMDQRVDQQYEQHVKAPRILATLYIVKNVAPRFTSCYPLSERPEAYFSLPSG